MSLPEVAGTGSDVGVGVGALGVAGAATGVLVGAAGVLVGATAVFVGATGVLVGAAAVFVGATGVLVGVVTPPVTVNVPETTATLVMAPAIELFVPARGGCDVSAN